MNSAFTKEKIEKLADLLMIGLTPEETQMVFDEFEIIDANISKVTEIEGLDKVIPMTHALDDFECVLREDEIEESINKDDLLSNCDEVDEGEVSVPKVVG